VPGAKTIIKELGLADKVKLSGFVPVEELPEHIAQADVGVVGNRKYTQEKQNYMLPVKMLEYAAMEIPTLAPRLRVITHYFDENSAIFYVPDSVADLANRIIETCSRREAIERTRQGLKRFNKHYNWCKMEQKYIAIVNKVCGFDDSGG
jgi:glycosyltransferase involved in cell wall biosynthesis